MKRRLFSDKDGSKFPEDIRAIIAEAKSKFDELIRKYGHIAEDIISILQRVEELTKEGSAADAIFDKIKLEFPDFFAVKAFDFIQETLPLLIKRMEETVAELAIEKDDATQAAFESFRHKSASVMFEGAVKILDNKNITRVESDSVVQEVYRLKTLLA